MDKFSYLGSAEAGAIESNYRLYKENPGALDSSWIRFFEGFEFARSRYHDDQQSGQSFDQEFKVLNLIDWYRKRGHLFTETNPVRVRRKYYPTLDIENYGLEKKDLDSVFEAGKNIGIGPAPLSKIVDHLKETYCRSVGAEFMFIRNPVILEWLQKKMEGTKNHAVFSREEQIHFYEQLNKAVGFEKYIHKKFVGQKRFSLEGAEALIPALDRVIEMGSRLGIKEFVIGMAHRGRLNVLANILQKPYADIFTEYRATEYEEGIELGDVKYHLGYDNIITTDSGQMVRLDLLPNPSHLEAVGPLVEGVARARLDNFCEGDQSQLAPIIIHGDAAVAGQGVVYEVVQMAQLPGYKTGGTIHIVINNQVGFTTNYVEARSSTYCTDIAKVTKAPVFHVNGDDVEALLYTIGLAMEFRQEFEQDVFIDLLCYRKYGHNEGDEPRFTQPLLYKAIANHPDVSNIYAQKLISSEAASREEIDIINIQYESILEKNFQTSQEESKASIRPFLKDDWELFHHPGAEDFGKQTNTAIEEGVLLDLAEKLISLPKGMNFFKKMQKIVDSRRKSIQEDKLDWAMGELLAYASLLTQGNRIRLSGQDSERGTFAHRHAALVQEDTGEKYYPLKNLSDTQSPFEVYNSPLSEYGVLGFEYGYALGSPNTLTIWEAQFGDFVNVAQIIIDQFISSAEEKWGVSNGIVLLLPHGYEGQGPEHSSARIERFLTLATGDNMEIVNPTTPANLFHMMRRHMMREFRIPLIVFTPKSLLRHPHCVSSLSEFSKGRFQKIIDDHETDAEDVKRVVFCSGKIYYDLLKQKQQWDTRDIALIRIEQLYPFPHDDFNKILKKYPNSKLHLWVQEEPENMGPWRFLSHEVRQIDWIPVCRAASASPATGLNKIHQIGQQEIIGKVFRTCNCKLKNKYCGLQCVEGKSRVEILKQFEYIPFTK